MTLYRREHGYPLSPASSSGDNYETPQAVFRYYNKLYHFYMDAAPSAQNERGRRSLTLKTNALVVPWTGPVCPTPPYSGLGRWIRKIHEESLRGCTVVTLLP